MLKPDDAVFVLIDVQGKLAQLMHRKEDLFRNLEILIKGLRVLEVPVLWLEQYPKGLGPTVPEIAALLPGETALPKVCFSGCGQPAFVSRLEALGRRRVLVAGIEAHICVYQTVRDLLDTGYEVEVVADAVSSRTPENRQVGLDRMRQMGAAVASVEMALFELLGEADTEVFRTVARLVK